MENLEIMKINGWRQLSEFTARSGDPERTKRPTHLPHVTRIGLASIPEPDPSSPEPGIRETRLRVPTLEAIGERR